MTEADGALIALMFLAYAVWLILKEQRS